MKREMDLRSDRFKKGKHIFQPRCYLVCLIPLILIGFVSLCYGGSAYCNYLNGHVEEERTALLLLQSEAEPLTRLVLSLEQSLKIAETVPLLMERSIPATRCLRQIRAAAASQEIEINSISIQDGEIEVSAVSKALHHAAAFRETLETLHFIQNAGLISIELADYSSYRFRISGTYQTGGGSKYEKEE